MTFHMAGGKPIHLQKWKMTRALEYGVRIEETLVSPAYIEVVTFSAIGTFQCGCCHKDINFEDAGNVVHVHVEKLHLICQPCYYHEMSQHQNAHCVDRLHMKFEDNVQLYVDAVEKTPCIEMVDTRFDNFNEKMEHYRTIAQKVAIANELTYLDGKNINDLRQDLLAKRVLRKWKKMVNCRRQAYLFQVLYSQMHDINASIVLAKQHAICLSVQ